MCYNYYFIIILIYVRTNIANSHFGTCVTPNNKNGVCVFLYQCPELNRLVQNKTLTQAGESLLIDSECRNVDADEAVLCCSSASRPTDPVSLLPAYPNCGVVSGTAERIVYSNVTKIWEYPWVALLLYSNPGAPPLIGCAGVLINKRYVLTAAHCLSHLSELNRIFELSNVRLGEWDTRTFIDIDGDIQGDPVVEVGIHEKIVHELFDSSKASNDIALIRLEKDVEYTNFIRPICIHRTDFLLNKDISTVEMLATGWGYTKGNIAGTKKFAVSFLGESIETCQIKYSPSGLILEETQLCGGGGNRMNRKETCIGDSGGPLVILDNSTIPPHYHAVGIMSFVPIPCGQLNIPGVYTKVFKYFSWIESKLRS